MLSLVRHSFVMQCILDHDNNIRLFTGYHTFAGVYFYKYAYDKTFFNEICSAELYGRKIMGNSNCNSYLDVTYLTPFPVPCEYNSVLTREYGKEWITPDKHHFLRSPGEVVYWAESQTYYAYQCLGKNQFDIRNYTFDEHNEQMFGMKEQHDQQSIKDQAEAYKTACNYLRWQ